MMDGMASEEATPEASGLVTDRPVTARVAVDKMVQSGLLDDLMEQVDSGDLQLTGEGGFLPELVRRVLEAGLAAELTDHLGYDKHDRVGHGSGNSRNGFTPKRLGTEIGDLELASPRDRNGTFEPRLVPKGQRRVGGLSDMIISLYAGGMTIRDIQAHLERTLGTQLSHETISNITDAVLEEVKAWQSRPLDPVYPILYLDALVGVGQGVPPGAEQGRPYCGRGRLRRGEACAGDLGAGHRGGEVLGGGAGRAPQPGGEGCADRLLRRADRVPGGDRGDLAEHGGPNLCGASDPGVDAVHLLWRPEGRRRRFAADLHRRHRVGRGG